VRLDRALQAGDVNVLAWEAEIQQIYEQEIAAHFSAEEKVLFPSARRFENLRELVSDLVQDHGILRDFCARAAAHSMALDELKTFATTLSTHIRKEERQLFEGLQQQMSPDELAVLGTALEEQLKNVADWCAVPDPATKLRSRKEIESLELPTTDRDENGNS
jgi:hemerythrin-like domain-containing protein